MEERTRIAIVGYGLIGKRHAEIIRRSPSLSLAAIVDPDEDDQAKAAHLSVPVFATLEEMMDNIALDGVVLATPTSLHLEQGLACIQRGCPVLVEKPITATAKEAYILTQAADDAGVPLLVGHYRRFSGVVRAAKEAISRIGDIRAVQVTSWFYKPDNYFKVAPWRTRKGAGPISVNTVHDVDLLRHFCGNARSVRSVAVPSKRGFENEDLAAAIVTFDSGSVAMLSVSDSIVSPWSWELTARENQAYPATHQSSYLIGGSHGSLSLPDLRIWQHTAERDWWTPMGATSLPCSLEDPLGVQMLHFARVIMGLEKPLVSGREGLQSLELVEAIARSAQTQTEIQMG